MNEKRLQDQLQMLIQEAVYACEDDDFPFDEIVEHAAGVRSVATFEEVGVLTRDKGLVIEAGNGAEFQLTIVQSRVGDAQTCDEEDCQ